MQFGFFVKHVFCVVFVFWGIPSIVNAQEITISGTLTDTKGGPIAYANIYLEHNVEIGTLTDYDGSYTFVIKTSEFNGNSTLKIVFSALGFKTKKIALENKSKEGFVVVLESETQILDEVVLSLESNATKEYTVLELNKIDIYSNPTANADPLLALQIYPYSTATDETANPSFRGSNADRSRVMLNGVPVFNPVRNNQINGLGNFSLFNTEIVDKQLIFPSNPPLIYGNSSAGLVEIETSKEVTNTSQVSLSLASAGFLISRNLDDNNFIQLYGNKQFSDWFLDVNGESIDFLSDFSTVDAGMNLRINTSDNSYFNLFTYFLREDIEAETSILNTVAPNTGTRTRFFTVANYSKIFENFKITFNSGYDYSKSPSLFANIDLVTTDASYYSALNVSFNLEKLFLKTGINYNFLDRSFKGRYPDFFFALEEDSPTSLIDNVVRTQILEGYAYGKITLDHFIFSAGIRKNIPLVRNRVNDVRFTDDYISYQSFVRWNLNTFNNLIFSAGKYHSYNNPNLINQNIALISSFQTSLDYTYQKKNTQIKASVYSKREKGVINNSFDLVENTISDRTIYGFEFQFDKTLFNDLKINASYTFINAEFLFEGERFRAFNDIDYFVKGSLTYFKKGWNLAISAITRPGTYFTDIESSVFNEDAMAFEPVFATAFNTEQLNNYFRLDFSANKSIDIGKHQLITYFSINNLLDRQNQRNIIFNTDFSEFSSEFFPERLFYFGAVFIFR